MFYIKQQNELVCSAKNSWTRMRPEAKPIEFTNGHAHFYGWKRWIKAEFSAAFTPDPSEIMLEC